MFPRHATSGYFITSSWRHRIEDPGGLLAIVSCSGTSCDPTATTNYVHRDHLGSPELVTNSSGTELVKLSFGAFGERWEAVVALAPKFGCSAETLRSWVRKADRDAGERSGPTSGERERLRVLEHENRELRRANEILRKASAFLAQAELDRRAK